MNVENVRDAVEKVLDAEFVEVTRHFFDELRADAFFLADVRCAMENITDVRGMAEDRAGHPKFEVTGTAADGRSLSVICSFKEGGVLLLITVYQAGE